MSIQCFFSTVTANTKIDYFKFVTSGWANPFRQNHIWRLRLIIIVIIIIIIIIICYLQRLLIYLESLNIFSGLVYPKTKKQEGSEF